MPPERTTESSLLGGLVSPTDLSACTGQEVSFIVGHMTLWGWPINLHFAVNALVTAGLCKLKNPFVHPEDEHTLHSVETI